MKSSQLMQPALVFFFLFFLRYGCNLRAGCSAEASLRLYFWWLYFYCASVVDLRATTLHGYLLWSEFSNPGFGRVELELASHYLLHLQSINFSINYNCAEGQHREHSTCGRKENCSLASAPLLLFFLLAPTLSLSSASFCSLFLSLHPWSLSWERTNQRGGRRGEKGEGWASMSDGERRVKGENSMWRNDRESRLWGCQKNKTESFLFFKKIWSFPPVISCC